MSKKWLISLTTAVVVIAIGSGVLFYFANRVTPAKLLQDYLEQSAASKTIDMQETFSGSGSEIVDKGSINMAKKIYIIKADLTCNTTVDDKPLSVKATIQQNGPAEYLRFNSASGEIRNADLNKTFDIAQAFSKIVGTWYKITDEDPAVKAAIDSSVYVSDSGVMAPTHNKQKVAQTLIDNQVFTYGTMTKQGSNYVLEVTAHRDAYLKALKTLFPKFTTPDLALQNAFGNKATLDFTLTLKKDGSFVSEDSSQQNLCVPIIETYFAPRHGSMPADLTGTVVPLAQGSTQLTPITTSKPISELVGDFVR